MGDKTWKAFERRICEKFNGKRRGADYGDGRVGKNDCKGTPGWSIEMKNMARPSFSIMLDDVRKAEQRCERQNDVPIGIMKRVGDHDDDALVVMRLEEFERLIVPLVREATLKWELGYDWTPR